MAIRDADAKRRNDNQAKLRAARLARDAAQSAEAPPPTEGKRTRRKAKAS
jgi:hypothetical protein